jgi:ATP-dependent Clp protease ATP-binding subunit ClpC
VALCEEEALRSGTGVIETDHLLLGLIRQGEGRAAVVLEELGVTLGAARQVSAEMRGARDPVLARGLLESNDYGSALEQAGALPRPEGGWVDTRHLLQGAVAVPGGVAAKLLQRLGVAPDQVTDGLSAPGEDTRPE